MPISLACHDVINDCQHSVSNRNEPAKNVIRGVSAEPRASKLPARHFMAKVPTAARECLLCIVKLKSKKDRRSLHNVANSDVLRYLVEMIQETLGTDTATVILPSACQPCLKEEH